MLRVVDREPHSLHGRWACRGDSGAHRMCLLLQIEWSMVLSTSFEVRGA